MLTGDELANQVCTLCNGLEQDSVTRRQRYQRALSLYEGAPVSLDSDGYFVDVNDQIPPLYNLTRSACDTAQADIAARQKPKPMFLTTGADWKARRRAKKLDRFVEAQMSERQGSYEDSWRLMLAAFHDSAKVGTGIAKVWADIEHKKVRVERAFPWELHVDRREARYGDPQNLFHCYDIERDIAIELFCNVEGDAEGNQKREMAIETAKSSRPDSLRVVDSVKIREAWRLPFSDEKPGKHAICVDGCTLFEEDWTRPDFPFVFLHWNQHTVGFWATGIAEEGEAQQLLINDASERLASRMRICSTQRTYFNGNVVKADDLAKGGDEEVLIECSDMSQAPQSPPPIPATQAEFEWVSENRQRYYEDRGVSTMTAQAQKPSGVTAAVAMQTLNDIATVRFLPKARGYETSFVRLGALMVQAAREIADEHGGYLVKWPGKRFLSDFSWSDVSLEEDMYSIRVAPVSQYSRDPAAILEMAQELRSSGDISRETFLAMIGLPDLEEMLSRETSEREYIEMILDRYLDSTTPEELIKAGGFEAPEPFLANKPAAMALCVSAYWEARRDHAPEFCCEMIRQFIEMLDKLIAPPAPAAPPTTPDALGTSGPVPPTGPVPGPLSGPTPPMQVAA